MKNFRIVYLKFSFELRLESFQLGYSAYQYDKIVHVEDFLPQMLVHLFDVQQMIHFVAT
jgi:hypothetical protein